VRGFVVGEPPWHIMSGLGWKSVGLLELIALPTIGEERWVPWVREADVLLVDGGDATYLCHWMRESGLANLLPSLSKTGRGNDSRFKQPYYTSDDSCCPSNGNFTGPDAHCSSLKNDSAWSKNVCHFHAAVVSHGLITNC
jgi:hypothetical protein